MIEWSKYGFQPVADWPGAYLRKDFPFLLTENEGCITVMSQDGHSFIFSLGRIPATNQSVVLLLKAFNLPKL